MYELLNIIPRDKWLDTIIGVRQETFPGNNTLREMEKGLIEVLLSEEPQDRPHDLSQVIDVITYLIETEKGTNELEWLIAFI